MLKMILFNAQSLHKPLFLFNGGATDRGICATLFATLWYGFGATG